MKVIYLVFFIIIFSSESFGAPGKKIVQNSNKKQNIVKEKKPVPASVPIKKEKQKSISEKKKPELSLSDTGEKIKGKIHFKMTGKLLQLYYDSDLVGKFVFPIIPLKIVLRKNFIFAACKNHGLYILDILGRRDPVIKKIIGKNKNVVDFTIKNNLLITVEAKYQLETWKIDTKKEEILPLIDLFKTKNGNRWFYTKQITKSIGIVIRVTRGWATIKAVSDISVSPGDRVEIQSMRSISHFDPLQNKSIKKPTREIVCVNNINKISRGIFSVPLGKGDAPEVGDEVFFSQRSISGSLIKPRRQRNIWRGMVELYPLLSSGSGSGSGDSMFFSAIMRGTLDYHGTQPYHLQIGVDPLQYLGTSEFSLSKRIGGDFSFVGSYETNMFEIGIGVGYQRPLFSGLSEHNRSGFLLVQMIRLGARDGLNLIAKFQSVYSDDNRNKHTRAMVGNFLGELNIPLSTNVNLFTRYFGDGRTLNSVSLGLRTFLYGNGGPGTLIIPVSIGYTSLTPYYYDESSNEVSQYEIFGVTFSVGIEKRF